jgi:hypothetical protein
VAEAAPLACFGVIAAPGQSNGSSVIVGTSGSDTLHGTSQQDVIAGLGGND